MQRDPTLGMLGVAMCWLLLGGAAFPALAVASGETLRTSGQALYTERGCGSCHSESAVAASKGEFPTIAGLPADYAAAQLEAFASGERKNAVMRGFALALTAEQRQMLAAYMASLPRERSPSPAAAELPGETHGAGLTLVTMNDGYPPASVVTGPPWPGTDRTSRR